MVLNGRKKVFVAMSGGVDSSVAAALLKEAGYEVVGIYMKCWTEQSGSGYSQCTTSQDKRSAAGAAAALSIPFEVWDFENEYRENVFKYFLDEYKNGRTPNPDVMCNKYIKFGVFLRKAIDMGADMIATGHYVCSKRDSSGKFRLFKAKDKNKDQSYFLYTLTQERLNYCLFPLGNLLKPEVRSLADKFGLPNAKRKDSQGLCFVGQVDLPSVLGGFMELEPGPIVDAEGRRLGTHNGLSAYTIGQRYGLGIGGTGPYFVAKKELDTNTLIAVKEQDSLLYTRQAAISFASWVDGEGPAGKTRVGVKLRYRQPDEEAEIENGLLRFAEPQRGVAEGQAAVCYQGEEMLGGGIITETIQK